MAKSIGSFAAIGAALLSACAAVPPPQAGTTLGLTWKVSDVAGGSKAVLIEADGRQTAAMRCQNGLLYVHVPAFRPILGPVPQPVQLHLGERPIALTQDYSEGGVTGVGRPQAGIGAQILSANEFRVVLGSQVFGPYIPPTGSEAIALAKACDAAASNRSS